LTNANRVQPTSIFQQLEFSSTLKSEKAVERFIESRISMTPKEVDQLEMSMVIVSKDQQIILNKIPEKKSIQSALKTNSN